MQKKKTGESEALYGELGHAFNFTQGDLEANRAGLITRRQEDYISYKFLEGNIIQFVLAFSSVILFPFILHYEFENLLLTVSLTTVLAVIAIVSTLIMPSGKWRDLQTDIQNHHVHSFVAKAKSIGVGKGHHLALVEEAGANKINISRKEYDVTKERGEYRVYCTMNSNKLLSVEHVI